MLWLYAFVHNSLTIKGDINKYNLQPVSLFWEKTGILGLGGENTHTHRKAYGYQKEDLII